MKSSSVGDVKASNHDTKEAGTDSAGSFKIATDAAHIENPEEVSEGGDDNSTLLEDVSTILLLLLIIAMDKQIPNFVAMMNQEFKQYCFSCNCNGKK